MNREGPTVSNMLGICSYLFPASTSFVSLQSHVTKCQEQKRKLRLKGVKRCVKINQFIWGHPPFTMCHHVTFCIVHSLYPTEICLYHERASWLHYQISIYFAVEQSTCTPFNRKVAVSKIHTFCFYLSVNLTVILYFIAPCTQYWISGWFVNFLYIFFL